MRKYYIVQSVPDLAGTVLPVKILNYPYAPANPVPVVPIVYGPPIIKLMPGINPYSVVNLKIIAPLFNFTLVLPYSYLRPVINDLYLKSLNCPIASPKTTFRIIAPGFDVQLVASYAGVYHALRYIEKKYGSNMHYTDLENLNKTDLKNLIEKIKKKLNIPNEYAPL